MPRQVQESKLKDQSITTFFKKAPKSKKITKNASKLIKPPDSVLYQAILDARINAINRGDNPNIAEAKIRKKHGIYSVSKLRQLHIHSFSFAPTTEVDDTDSDLENAPNDGVDMGIGDIKDSIYSHRYFKEAKTVLEIGCGTGRNTEHLFNMGNEIQVDVVDFNQRYIWYMKKIFRCKVRNYFVGDVLKIQEVVRGKKYDCIWIQGLLQYFNDS